MILDVERLMGPQEVMALLGVSRQRVYQLTQQPGFPEPAAILAVGRVWNTDDVLAWAKRVGRTVNTDDED